MTLFLQTLLWFLGTSVITIAAVVLVGFVGLEPEEYRPPPFGMLVTLQLSEARFAYETGGRPALSRALTRFRRITGAEGVLTGPDGTDLLTGENRSDLVALAKSSSRFYLLRLDRTAVPRRSFDGRYYYFLILDRGHWITWFIRPFHHLAVLAVLLLLCYAFARHLTNPVRALQQAVDRFGRGDLKARVASKRRDELGQLARTFDRMADRTEVLLSAERRLLLDISHELRSPLARLGVAVELARSSQDPEKHLARIEKEAGRLNSLVGELLQVTRAEGDATRRNWGLVDVEQLVSSVVDDCRLEAEARGCTIELHRQPFLLPGDPELLRRAVENVLRNAIHHAPPGAAIDVTLTGTVIRIRDRGPGVPEEALDRIFDPFFRVETDRSRDTGGAGLGLSIARRAVELHGGTITARNANPGLEVAIAFSQNKA